MPIVPIPINKGAFKNVDDENVAAPDVATEMKNLVIDDTGANVDRPGLSQTAFGQTGSAAGIVGAFYFRSQDCVVLVDTGRRVWKLTEAGVTTDITGTSLGGTARPVFADDGTYVAIAGGGTMLQWSGTGTTTALAGSPPASTHISYLDGYWMSFLLDDQEFRFAGPTAVSRATWNTGDFFQAEGLPDNILAQAVLLRELYAFGRTSTEIFQNFGSTNPFQRTFFIDTGLGAVHSLLKWDNSLSWLDNERRLVRMEGRTPVQFNKPIDRIIKNYTTVDDCWAAYMPIGGFNFVVYAFPSEETSWVYDPIRQEWYEWDGFAGVNQARFPMNAHVFVPEWNKHLVGDPYTGVVYSLSFDAKVDGANILRRLRRMRYKHGTGKKKRSNAYYFHVKQGVGTDGGTEPVFEVRVNDDNKGWSQPKQVSLGNPGAKQTPLRVRMGGIYRERQLEVQMTDPYALSISAIEEDVDILPGS